MAATTHLHDRHRGLIPIEQLTGSTIVDDDILQWDATLGELVAVPIPTGGGGGGVTATPETPAGTIDGANDTFTLSTTPTAGVILFKNGLVQREGAGEDYTLAADTITYEAGNIPQTGDSHVAYMLAAAGGGGGVTDVYGDGQDGDITVNSGTFSVSVGGSALITNNVLQRDAYFDTLELNGGDLDCRGFKVWCKTELILTSGDVKYVGNNGNNGGNGTAVGLGSAGTGGAAHGAGSTIANVIGKNGVVGGFNANGANGVIATASSAGLGTSPAGVNGGDSGQGQTGGVGGASIASTNTLTERPADYSHATTFRRHDAVPIALSVFVAQSGSSGGGAGSAASGGGGSGGNGATGGALIVFARAVTGSGDIRSTGGAGGNGGNGGGTNAGGGAGGTGGNGGFACLVYSDISGWSGSLSAAGGAGGNGGALIGTGVNGQNGNTGRAGYTISFQVNA